MKMVLSRNSTITEPFSNAASFDEGAESDAGVATGVADHAAVGVVVRLHVPARFDAADHAGDQLYCAGDAFHGDTARHRAARRNVYGFAAGGGHAQCDGRCAAGLERRAIPQETGMKKC